MNFLWYSYSDVCIQIYDSVSILMLRKRKMKNEKTVIWFATVISKSGIKRITKKKKNYSLYSYEPEK